MNGPVTIVGGGLAGLTLGIGLRQRGVPVAIWEAGRYPRHRVCGEFISGRGLEVLARLGVKEKIEAAGAVNASTAEFFSASKGSGVRALSSPALCLSRFVLDDLLAAEFRWLGGELREGERWHEKDFSEGVVRATGRRSQTQENGWKWFGLKAHARGVALKADLEIHVAPRGYVGLCRLANGDVNVCGLFRGKTGSGGGGESGFVLLQGERDSLLNRKLAEANFDAGSFCSVAGLSLLPQSASAREECCLGDAVTMIPPVTGNGMSIAFESGEIATGPLTEWSAGKISWDQAKRVIAQECDGAFARRLRWARWLQALVLSPVLQRPLVSLAARSEKFWRLWFERTR